MGPNIIRKATAVVFRTMFGHNAPTEKQKLSNKKTLTDYIILFFECLL